MTKNQDLIRRESGGDSVRKLTKNQDLTLQESGGDSVRKLTKNPNLTLFVLNNMSVEAVLLVLSTLYVHQVVQVKKNHVSFKFRRKDEASFTTKVPVTEVGEGTEKGLLEHAYGNITVDTGQQDWWTNQKYVLGDTVMIQIKVWDNGNNIANERGEVTFNMENDNEIERVFGPSVEQQVTSQRKPFIEHWKQQQSRMTEESYWTYQLGIMYPNGKAKGILSEFPTVSKFLCALREDVTTVGCGMNEFGCEPIIYYNFLKKYGADHPSNGAERNSSCMEMKRIISKSIASGRCTSTV